MAEHPNVAIVRNAYESFGKGDLEGALADLTTTACSTSAEMVRTVVTTRAARPSPRP